MNYCDYYVKQVLAEPVRSGYGDTVWWEVRVSYFYDNGQLKVTDLVFDTEEQAKEVKTGFHFLA
ncbi:hypothetical protein ABEW81_11090 [Priestia megaterium]